MNDAREHLIGHLKLLDEFGIAGFSESAAWSRRPAEGLAGEQAAQAPGSLAAVEVSSAADASAPDDAAEVWAGAPSGEVSAFTEPADAQAALDALRAYIGDCTRCKLHALGRSQVVFGVGHPKASLMFVGEGPGQEEDAQGIPFVGRAGQLLTKIIEAIGLTRDQVYIANVVKCRPPGNRNPEPDEIATCEPFLSRQIDAIAPKVIVALGTFAAQTLLRTKDPISKLRGQVFDYRGARLVPTFHPAFLLRSPERKRDTWEDMKKVMALLADAREGE